MTVGFGLAESLPTVPGAPPLAWLIPGVVLMVAFAGPLFTTFNDLFQHRGFDQFYCTIYASPSTAWVTVSGLLLSTVPEGVVRSLVALGILQALLGWTYSVFGQLLFVLLIVVTVLIGAAVGLTVGMLARDSTASQIMILLLLMGLGFCSEWFVPFHVYPEAVQPLFNSFPTSVLAQTGRGLLLDQDYALAGILIPLGTVIILTILNGYLFARISTE